MLVYIWHWHTHSSGKEIIVAFCNNNHVKEATNGNAHTEWLMFEMMTLKAKAKNMYVFTLKNCKQ